MVLKVRFELTRIISPVGFEPTASTVPPLEQKQGLRKFNTAISAAEVSGHVSSLSTNETIWTRRII